MLPNQTNQQKTPRQIADGMSVYSMDGVKVGAVRNYDPLAGYLDIQQGWHFTKDLYVGLAEIHTVNEKGITLRLTRDELEEDRFSSLPPPHQVLSKMGFVVTEKGPFDVEDEEVPQTHASGMPVY